MLSFGHFLSPAASMFLIAKMALVTCAFYIAIAIVLEVALLLVVYKKGGIFYHLNPWGWGLVFAVVWLISFALAWRVFMVRLSSTFPKAPLK